MMKAIWMLGLLTLAGCQYPQHPKPDDPNLPPSTANLSWCRCLTGAIFQPEQVSGIYSDIKAHGMVTSSPSSWRSRPRRRKGQHQSGKDNSFDLSPVSLGGGAGDGEPLQRLLPPPSIRQRLSRAGQGGSEQQPAGQHLGQRGQVLPNGNLLVRGEKWIMLNNGNEYIRITGLVRPEDVSSENSVSQKVANARIHYGGTGDLANTQEQGWLTSFFNGPLVAHLKTRQPGSLPIRTTVVSLGDVMNRFRLLALLCCLLPLGLAHASRIRTSPRWKGRSNQLIGYGLVVGLPGTGEEQRLHRADLQTSNT